jgi:hypothetical protein
MFFFIRWLLIVHAPHWQHSTNPLGKPMKVSCNCSPFLYFFARVTIFFGSIQSPSLPILNTFVWLGYLNKVMLNIYLTLENMTPPNFLAALFVRFILSYIYIWDWIQEGEIKKVFLYFMESRQDLESANKKTSGFGMV